MATLHGRSKQIKSKFKDLAKQRKAAGTNATSVAAASAVDLSAAQNEEAKAAALAAKDMENFAQQVAAVEDSGRDHRSNALLLDLQETLQEQIGTKSIFSKKLLQEWCAACLDGKGKPLSKAGSRLELAKRLITKGPCKYTAEFFTQYAEEQRPPATA